MEFGGQGPRAGADEMGVGGYASSPSSGNNGAAAAVGHREEVAVRYHECLRNHAAAQGGHVVDGCGEFMPMPMPAGLTCAACGCHRSFHRKDDGLHHRLHLPLPAPPPPPLLMPPPLPHHYPPFPYHHHGRTPSGGGTMTTESSSDDPGPPPPQPSSSAAAHASPGRRKRFRTRFTAEQKERMLAFAERVGWRMQRQDEAMVDRFCAQVGVRRQVFKVWMHNNKQLRRQQQQDQQSQQPQDQQQQ